jgi:hypothetical protein
MESSDDIESLPIDENEKFVASEFSALQRVVKKRSGDSLATTTTPTDSPSDSRLVRDLKIVLISTVLFLVVGHPKLTEMLNKFRLDTLTLYTIKASIFAILLFILINRTC